MSSFASLNSEPAEAFISKEKKAPDVKRCMKTSDFSFFSPHRENEQLPVGFKDFTDFTRSQKPERENIFFTFRMREDEMGSLFSAVASWWRIKSSSSSSAVPSRCLYVQTEGETVKRLLVQRGNITHTRGFSQNAHLPKRFWPPND